MKVIIDPISLPGSLSRQSDVVCFAFKMSLRGFSGCTDISGRETSVTLELRDGNDVNSVYVSHGSFFALCQMLDEEYMWPVTTVNAHIEGICNMILKQVFEIWEEILVLQVLRAMMVKV